LSTGIGTRSDSAQRAGDHLEQLFLADATPFRQCHRFGHRFDGGENHEVAAELDEIRRGRGLADVKHPLADRLEQRPGAVQIGLPAAGDDE
jgi:hypothetical protein